MQTEPQRRNDEQNLAKSDKKPIIWKGYADLDLRWPEWLIKHILPMQSMICLYGKRSQGKTFVALDWACSIAAAKVGERPREWANKDVTPGKVAYLLAENPDGIKRRVHGWIQHHHNTKTLEETDKVGKELLGDNASTFVVAQGRVAVDSKDQRDVLVESLKSLGDLSLIVLDPLVSFMNGSENDTRDMQEFVEGVRDLVKRCGCSVLLVHHEGKGNVRNALGARGSSALEAGMDTVIHMKGINQYHSELEITKQREARAHSNLMLRFDEREYGADRPLGKFPTLVDAAEIKGETTTNKLPRESKEKRTSQLCQIHKEAIIQLHSRQIGSTTIENIVDELPKDAKKSASTTRRILLILEKDQQIKTIKRKGKVLQHYIPISNPDEMSEDAA